MPPVNRLYLEALHQRIRRYLLVWLALVILCVLLVAALLLHPARPTHAALLAIGLTGVALAAVVPITARREFGTHMAERGQFVSAVVVERYHEGRPGSLRLPCQLLFTYDSSPDVLARLQELAKRAYQIKGTLPSSPALRETALMLLDCRETPQRRHRLPDDFTGGLAVYVIDTVVRTQDLRIEGALENRHVLPCLAEIDDPGRVVVVPWQIMQEVERLTGAQKSSARVSAS